jgi:uncharacterized protein (DUF433 family)
MELASPPIEIERDPERCGGAPTLAGTRTTIHDIVSYAKLYDGDLERAHEEALPHLSLEVIRAAMVWYSEHSSEIDKILKRRQRSYERSLSKASASR